MQNTSEYFIGQNILTRMTEIFIIRRVIFVLSVPLSVITVTICVRFHLQPEMASSLSCLAVSEHPLWDWIPWEWSWARTFYPRQPRGGCWRHRSDYPWKTAEKGARNSTQSQLLLLVQYCPGNSQQSVLFTNSVNSQWFIIHFYWICFQ